MVEAVPGVCMTRVSESVEAPVPVQEKEVLVVDCSEDEQPPAIAQPKSSWLARIDRLKEKERARRQRAIQHQPPINPIRVEVRKIVQKPQIKKSAGSPQDKQARSPLMFVCFVGVL